MSIHNTVKKTKLSAAMAVALLGGTLAGNAQAVNLTPDGLGDAALFSYFSAKSTWQTFIRLINTSDDAVAVKVRFREAANSREILDFVVILSPKDMWVGWTDGAAINGKPGIRTGDSSCIYEGVGATHDAGEGFQKVHGSVIAAQFKDRSFTGDYADDYNAAGADKKSVDARLREGHIEVIGIAKFGPGTDVYRGSLHGNGTPTSCPTAIGALKQAANNALVGHLDYNSDVGNVIAANAYMINVAAGQGGGYDPTILANFYTGSSQFGRTAVSPLAGIAHTDMKPNLDSGDPVSTLMTAEQLFLAGWDLDQPGSKDGNKNNDLHRHGNVNKGIEVLGGGVDAVSSLLMRTNVINEWAAKSNGRIIKDYFTQWVLTFPTKNYYVDIDQDKVVGDHTYPTLACVAGSPKEAGIAFQAALSAAAAAEGAYIPVAAAIGALPNPQAVYNALLAQITAVVAASSAGDIWDNHKAILAAIDAQVATYVAAAAGSPTALDFLLKAGEYIKAGVIVDLHKKEYSCDKAPGVINPDGFAPFTNRFQAKGMSCEPYKINMWNREESHASFTSPRPRTNPGLCYETNVLAFGDQYAAKGLASNFASVVPQLNLPTDSSDAVKSVFGWADLKFTGKNAGKGLVSHNGIVVGANDLANPQALGVSLLPYIGKDNWFTSKLTLKGLPVDGFMFSVYTTEGGAISNHTTINEHKYKRDISDNRPHYK